MRLAEEIFFFLINHLNYQISLSRRSVAINYDSLRVVYSFCRHRRRHQQYASHPQAYQQHHQHHHHYHYHYYYHQKCQHHHDLNHQRNSSINIIANNLTNQSKDQPNRLAVQILSKYRLTNCIRVCNQSKLST